MSFVRFLPLPSEVIELRIEWGAMPLWFEAAVLFFCRLWRYWRNDCLSSGTRRSTRLTVFQMTPRFGTTSTGHRPPSSRAP